MEYDMLQAISKAVQSSIKPISQTAVGVAGGLFLAEGISTAAAAVINLFPGGNGEKKKTDS